MSNQVVNKNNFYGVFTTFLIFLTPTITFGIFESDLSPFYLIVLFLIQAKFNLFEFVVLGYLFLITAISSIILKDFQLTKLSFVILMSYFLINLNKSNFFKQNLLFITSVIWCSSGIITLFNPNIFSFFIYRIGYTIGRGAVGFTPEPAFYGLSSVFLYGLCRQYFLFTKDTKIKFSIFLFTISTFISLSFYAILIFILISVFYIKLRFNLLKIIMFLFFIIFIVYLSENLSKLRIFSLINIILKNPGFILNDHSIMYRFNSFIDIYDALTFNSTGKKGLTSGFSLIFYQFNYFSIIFIFLYFLILKVNLLPLFKISFLLIFFVLLFIGPMSIPYFWIWLSSLAYIKKDNMIKI